MAHRQRNSRGGYSNLQRAPARLSRNGPNFRWSAQDARGSNSNYNYAEAGPSNLHSGNYTYRGAHFGSASAQNPLLPSTYRFLETPTGDHMGFSSYANPMWNEQGIAMEPGADPDQDFHAEQRDLFMENLQRRGVSASTMTGAPPAHQFQTEQRQQSHVHLSAESSLSKRLGLAIPRVEIPRGDIPANELPRWAQALQKTAEITTAMWGDKPKVTISMDIQDAADYTQYLLDHAMIGYFTSQCPLLDDFYDWVIHEFTNARGWKVPLVKFVGKNFYLILFENPKHRQEALSYHPWKYNNKFVYFFAWEPEFNVSTGQYTKLPVWVELTYRDIGLEHMRIKIVESLGPVLLYLQEDDHSVFPRDRACILWEMNKPIPHSVEVLIGNGMAVYQPVIFKNLPFTCFNCNGHGHIARDCKVEEPIDNPAGVGYPEYQESDKIRRGQPPAMGRNLQYQAQHFYRSGVQVT